MNLRIARVSSIQSMRAIQALYADSKLAGCSYVEQLERVLKQRVYYSDTFERAMRALGHTTLGVIYDVDPLQKAWCRENKYDWSEEGRAGAAIGQLRAWSPDVIYLQDLFTFPRAIRMRLKEYVPSAKAVVLYKGSPGAIDEIKGIDHVFAATPYLTDAFRRIGCKSTLLYHSFDPSVLESSVEDPESTSPLEATFAGTSGYAWGSNFQARYWLLKALLERIPEFEAWVEERENCSVSRLAIWRSLKYGIEGLPAMLLGPMSQSSCFPGAVRRVAAQSLFERRALDLNRRQFPDEPFFKKPRHPDKPLRREFKDRCHEAVFGLDLYRLLRRSQLTVNRHTDVTAGQAGNIRLFEATGLGACLVTDRCSNLGDLFEDDREVITYGSTNECLEKVRWLIDHPAERKRIALAGQARTLRDHTMAHRAQVISEELQKLIAQR